MTKKIETVDLRHNELQVEDIDLGYQHAELTETSGKLKDILDEILTRLDAVEGP